MYIAIMYGKVIDVGAEITVEGIPDFKFEVTSIDPDKRAFGVVWTAGSNAGQKDSLPFTIFGSDVVTVKEIPDDNNPNSAFMRKKYEE